MDYILYSTPVKLNKIEVMVPPISMYHMKRLLELRDSGTNFETPGKEDLTKILNLIGDVIRENHPDLTDEVLEKEINPVNLREIMSAIQGLPKNSTAQTGNQVSPDLSKSQETTA